MKRIFSLILLFAILAGCFSGAGFATDAADASLSVIYIPIDDRPFNDERMQLMAGSLGIELIMPDKMLYATVLDGQSDSGYSCGDRAALLQWLMDNEDRADVLILSLDQLLSGGLLNSRCLEEMSSVTLADGTVMTEADMIDYLATLSSEKELYLIDSVMRLAASFGFAGFTIEDYNITRLYGLVARPVLEGDELTIENIVETYRLSQDGTQAYLSAGLKEEQIAYLLGQENIMPDREDQLAAVWDYIQGVDPEFQPMTESVLMELGEDETGPGMEEAEESLLGTYLSIRERKLRLTDYALETLCGGENVHYLLGVDDSNQGEQIQSNEIRYFEKQMSGDDEIVGAMDGLGQMALCKIYQQHLGIQGIGVNVSYFGYGKYTINDFNFKSNDENIDQLLSYYGCRESQEDSEVDVLIFCGAALEGVRNADLYKLVSRLNENQSAGIPTILVDVSQSARSLMSVLPLEQVKIGSLLAYSGITEGPGQVQMAINQGLARYFSLKHEEAPSQAENKAHLMNLLSVLTEEVYDTSVMNANMFTFIRNMGQTDPLAQVTDEQLETIYEELATQVIHLQPMLESFLSSNFFVSLEPCTMAGITAASIQNLYYPWLRQFEIWGEYSCDYSETVHENGQMHVGVVNGVAWTEFQPEALLTREQAAKMLMTFSQTTVDKSLVSPFDDVSQWAYVYVANAAAKGYILGCDDGTFQGQRNMTRAEFAAMLYQYVTAEKVTLEAGETKDFTDVAREGQWYSQAVYALAESGVIHGLPDGSFNPEMVVTRAEAVAMLSRLFQRDEALPESLKTLPRYVDVSTEFWAYEAIQEASISHFCK